MNTYIFHDWFLAFGLFLVGNLCFMLSTVLTFSLRSICIFYCCVALPEIYLVRFFSIVIYCFYTYRSYQFVPAFVFLVSWFVMSSLEDIPCLSHVIGLPPISLVLTLSDLHSCLSPALPRHSHVFHLTCH